jgi:hypothetical protein
MFAPLFGVPEDPATGGANVALIGLLAHHRPETDLVSPRPSARASTWDARHPRSRGREEGRHGDRDLYRRALRADDEGHDRPHLRPHLTQGVYGQIRSRHQGLADVRFWVRFGLRQDLASGPKMTQIRHDGRAGVNALLRPDHYRSMTWLLSLVVGRTRRKVATNTSVLLSFGNGEV